MPFPAFGDVPTWVAAIGGLGAAFTALRQLKNQDTEQQRQAAEQARLAKLQAAQAEAQRRAQAEDVSVLRTAAQVGFYGIQKDAFEELIIENNSRRPIRNVRARIKNRDTWISDKGALPASPSGTVVAEEEGGFERLPLRLLRGGTKRHILFGVLSEPGDREFEIWFDDDAGNRWAIDQDMRLRDRGSEA